MTQPKHRSVSQFPVTYTRVSAVLYWPIGVAILIFAAVVRFWDIASRPGWEWDEGVYVDISATLADTGLMHVKTEHMTEPEPYTYHPPFHFWLVSFWFRLVGSGITEARVLAVISALAGMALLLVFLRRMLGMWALAAVALLATDAWLIFSQRVSWIENTLIPLGIAGLWLYYKATTSKSLWLFALAGLVVVFAASYKYVGVIFLGAVVIHAVLSWRQSRRGYLLMFAVMGMAVIGHVLVMVSLYGTTYLTASKIQLLRSIGEQSSAGALTSVADIVSPLLAQYKIFVATLVLAGISGVLVAVRTVQIIARRTIAPVQGHLILYSWALAAIGFFAALQLRFPHYFMLALVPLLCYLAAEVRQAVIASRGSGRSVAVRRFLLVSIIVIAVCNAGAFVARFVAPVNDAALKSVAQYAASELPADAIVIADESVGVLIPQPYCNMWRGNMCEGAKYVITYESQTQKKPTENGMEELLASSKKLRVVDGFKEVITVYRLNTPVPYT